MLLAEDNLVNQEIAVDLLKAVGLEVDVAIDGREAVRLAPLRDYALVLMDVQMPGMDGLQATRELRALPALRGLPVVAMTAHVSAEDRRACLAAGMNDHVAKPVDPQLLYAALRRWLPGGTVDARPRPRAAENEALREVDGLGRIEGFDAALGLRLSGLRPDTYRMVLRRFTEVYHDALPSLETLAEGGRWPELTRAAHSLRGACASIGAQQLQAQAETLETLSEAPAPAGAVAESVRVLRADLRTLVATLREHLRR